MYNGSVAEVTSRRSAIYFKFGRWPILAKYVTAYIPLWPTYLQ